MSVNKVILIGNLGKDPEIRTTGSGMSIGNLTLATSRRRKDRDGQWGEETEWHRVVCFGKTAENVGKYQKKGSKLYIEGRIQTKKWQDKEGRDRWTTEVVADQIQFLGSKGETSESGNSYSGNSRSSRSTNTGRNTAHKDYDEDDIPF